jgi:membrane protease YdiL (CAAX protease family)
MDKNILHQLSLQNGGNDAITFWVIVLCTAFFTVYWFIFDSKKIKDWFYKKYPTRQAAINHIIFTKIAGFVLMGLLPLFVFTILLPQYSVADYGISFSKGTNVLSLYWILGLSGIILVLNWFAARRPKTFSIYPQIRVKEWDYSLIGLYSVAWSLYLLGYEALFRGFLFFPLVKTLGVVPAIAVNIALYATTHIPKGLDETIGAPILGFVLCLITVQTQTIWVATVVHIVLALSNSLIALRFHPEMVIKR